MNFRQLSEDIEAGKYGKIIKLIPVVQFQDEDGKDRVGTLNHGRTPYELIGVGILLLAAMKGILIALRALL